MSKILDSLLPTPCIVCSVNGAPICKSCANRFQSERLSFEIDGVTGFAITKYTDESARIINAVKESGITSLVPFMAREMFANWPSTVESPVLVPLPSSPSNARARGYSQTMLIAKQLARALPGAKVSALLKSSRARQDQVGLSAQQRKINLTKAFAADLRGFPGEYGPIFLVDDVCTTGATLTEAISTLREAGLAVAGFVVFAKAGS